MKISVIIPAYNTAGYINDAIQSALKSDYVDYEMVLVDDGSTDNTREIINNYLSLPNFRYIYQSNAGLAAARNTGIEQAKGEYLVFLDSDDMIHADKFSVQATFLDHHPEYDVVYSDTICFVENNPDELVKLNFPHYSGNILESLLYGNFMHVNTLMARKEKVLAAGKFDAGFRELEDWDLWLRMSLNGSRFYYQDQVLSKVRVRKGSMTHQQLKMNKTMVRVLQKFIASLPHHRHLDNYYRLRSKAHESLFTYRLHAEEKEHYLADLSKTLFGLGLSFSPIALKLAIKYGLSLFYKQKNKTTEQLMQIWGNAK